jgi:hypothetical protein
MTDLRKLNVSLTKHGSHKIAGLLRKYDKDSVLKHVKNSDLNVDIDLSQAKKNLSTSKGQVPDLWNKARQNGNTTIDAVVLIAIILSHHELISVLKNSSSRLRFEGTIRRSDFKSEKVFTNLAGIIYELGYSIEHTKDHVRYDLSKLFTIPGLHTLIWELIRLKLVDAGWDESNTLIEESITHELHEVFSLTEEQFRTWLTIGSPSMESSAGTPDDVEFFAVAADDDRPAGKFEFQPGHNIKKIGTVRKNPATSTAAELLHNKIQNQMYDKLIEQYGESCVRTEAPTGDGTTVDIVVKTDQFCRFYEIKTALSVRAYIRQAIPQLLEYAYWQGDSSRADKLIIVSPRKLTLQAERYLMFLQNQFKLNIHYEQFEVK